MKYLRAAMILAGLAGLALLLNLVLDDGRRSPDASTTDGRQIVSAAGIRLRDFDHRGLAIEIQAPQLTQLQGEAFFRLDSPFITLFENKTPRGLLRAELAKLSDDQTLVLEGSVSATRSDRDVRLETTTLWLDLAERRAGSNARVKIHFPGGQLEGRGLDWNLETGQLVLREDTRTLYRKQRPEPHREQRDP